MTEDEILAQYSTPGLKRNQLTRFAMKTNMEFDARYKHLTKAERDDILNKLFPEDPKSCPPSPITNPPPSSNS